MKIGVIGTGYVGLVQGVILAEFGLSVTCMDVDSAKIQSLKDTHMPIYEPGLVDLVKKNQIEKRLHFTTDLKTTVENNDVIFIAVGTPSKEDGSADLQYVLAVAENIAQYLSVYKVVVVKSTVPVGTCNLVKKTIKEQLRLLGKTTEFDVVSNPEFLREGKAMQDALTPDRVVIGAESQKAAEIMKNVYSVLYINQTPFVFTNFSTAEMIKYASNAFLAVKISYINELSLLSEKVGADIQEVAKAMGMDGRISHKFLHAGPGYGGSCFPKDTKALLEIGKQNGEDLFIVKAAISANQKQKKKMVDKISFNLDVKGNLTGKKIAILGLSFKPETDDMRESPAIDIITGLVKAGARIVAYCPKGMQEATWRLEHVSESVSYAENEYDAAEGSDALVILTEWNQFRGLDFDLIRKKMTGDFFFDLRNIYSRRKEQLLKFRYFGVGQNGI